MNDERECRNCKFGKCISKPFEGFSGKGTCKRNPPSIFIGSEPDDSENEGYFVNPMTDGFDWCGEYKPK